MQSRLRQLFLPVNVMTDLWLRLAEVCGDKARELGSVRNKSSSTRPHSKQSRTVSDTGPLPIHKEFEIRSPVPHVTDAVQAD